MVPNFEAGDLVRVVQQDMFDNQHYNKLGTVTTTIYSLPEEFPLCPLQMVDGGYLWLPKTDLEKETVYGPNQRFKE